MPRQRFWFYAKCYGWGWGYPSCWQGWAVFEVAIALVAVLRLLFPFHVYPGFSGLSLFVVAAGVLVIMGLKGERPNNWHGGP